MKFKKKMQINDRFLYFEFFKKKTLKKKMELGIDAGYQIRGLKATQLANFWVSVSDNIYNLLELILDLK